MKQFTDKVSILVLDYNKPEESRLCLESVQKHCKFEKEVVFYSNGGEQDYVIDFYKEGLIDKLVLSKKNFGLGIGTTDLLQLCRTEFFIYLQNDQYFQRPLYDGEIQTFKYCLGLGHVGSISLAGYPCGEGVYSDRCHFGKTQFFRDMDKWMGSYPDGGCGPYFSGSDTYNENFIQRYFKEFGLFNVASNPHYVIDNGKWSFRENADGSMWKHKPSTKELNLIKGPVLEKFGYPNLTDEEWVSVLKNQSWPKNKIPERELPFSFKVEGWD